MAYHSVATTSLLESYHDAVHAKEEALTLFNVGHLSLDNLAAIDQLYWATSVKIRDTAIAQEEEQPEELRDLTARLSDSYFCNLSLFQSLPDTWAIGQTFPIMPIHRLNEQPTRRGTLVDITCDSDGKIDCFIGERGPQPTLALHEVEENDPYYLAAFLTGAYQETLGDLHNLFGDPHVAHIRIDEQGRWTLDQFVEGDTVSEVLTYLQYDIEDLRRSIRKDCENAVQSGKMTPAESRQIVDAYTQGLAGYTYLE